jgi:CHAD domain-containing protein
MRTGEVVQPTEIVQYASEQISTRLGKFAFQVAATSKAADSEAVHDLRVAIRRFDEGLTLFQSLIPKKEVKKVRRRLREIRRAAGQVRDRDIALQFLRDSGVEKEDALFARIAAERRVAESSLSKLLRKWGAANLSRKWRAALQLDRP